VLHHVAPGRLERVEGDRDDLDGMIGKPGE
jgi:hypothetical protein